MTKTIILIPSRLEATRLPNKPLLKIQNKSLINHVYDKGKSTNIGEVYVATGDKEIFEDVIKNNGKCILTKKNHFTGTDRIFDAYEQLNQNDNFHKVNDKLINDSYAFFDYSEFNLKYSLTNISFSGWI